MPMANLKKPKLLVVDDNDVFRGALKLTLEQENYEVTVAANGRNAQEIVGLDDYAAVISDIRMTPVNGIELLHHIKRTKPVPVILMTGFSELMEAKQAADVGADGFLAKPFKSEDLMEVLNKLLPKADEKRKTEEPKPLDDEYSKISIDDFVTGREMKYDIFIRVSPDKYLKVAHQGEDISLDRIKAYKAKGLTHLYMKKTDFRAYLGFSLMLSSALKTNDSINKSKRINLMKHTGELIMSQLYSNEIKKEDFESARTIVETAVELLSESNDLCELLTALNSHTDFLYAHSLGVSLYATLIAKEMSWNSPANHYKISVGGLLHDIGKKEIQKDILEKQRVRLSAEEIKTLETHPTRGMEILSKISSMPSDILQIVSQHHESCTGTGYPGRRAKSKIHPFAKLIAVANEFCNLVIKNPDSPGIQVKEAMQRLGLLYQEHFDPVFVNALGRILRVEIEEDVKKKKVA